MSNLSGSNDTFLGSGATPLTSNDSNETVIGASAVGLGSNTTVIGNSSNMTTALFGNVGVGTTSPAATLDVNGSIRVAALGANNSNPICTGANGILTNLGCSGGTGTPPTALGTVTAGTWNATAIASAYLPSDIDYIDQAQTFTGQKSFASNVGIGTTSPGAEVESVNPQNWNYGVNFRASSSQTGNADGVHISFLKAGVNKAWSAGILNGASESGFGISENGDITGFGTPRFYIQSVTGYAGIGTTTPGSTLEVHGNVTVSGGGSNITFPDATTQSTAWNGTTLGGDYAEAVDVLGDRAAYEPGDVITIDASSPGKFAKSVNAYSRLVAGVYSTKPGLVGRRTTIDRPNKEAELPMAMMGIVPTKVSAENGPIAPGDLLVSAGTPGYAMKGTDVSRMMGAVIGKALAPLEAGSGIIEVLISLQ